MSKSDQFLGKPVLTVTNVHFDSCGKPPDLKTGLGNSTFYAENDYGEQMVLVLNRTTGAAWLYHGDAGWEHPYPVIDGFAVGITMHQEEVDWLRSCWSLATCYWEQPKSFIDEHKKIDRYCAKTFGKHYASRALASTYMKAYCATHRHDDVLPSDVVERSKDYGRFRVEMLEMIEREIGITPEIIERYLSKLRNYVPLTPIDKEDIAEWEKAKASYERTSRE